MLSNGILGWEDIQKTEATGVNSLVLKDLSTVIEINNNKENVTILGIKNDGKCVIIKFTHMEFIT